MNTEIQAYYETSSEFIVFRNLIFISKINLTCESSDFRHKLSDTAFSKFLTAYKLWLNHTHKQKGLSFD